MSQKARFSTAPSFLLLLVLLCIVGMLATSLRNLALTPTAANQDPEKSGATTAAVSSAPPAGVGTIPADGSGPDMTEKQAETLTELMKQLQSSPNDADVLMGIGDTFLMAKDWQRADAFLSRAILSRPGDIRPRYLFGISQYQQGKMEKAAEAFEELLAVKEDTVTLYNLALIYKYHLNKKDRAHELLQKIVSASEVDAEILEKARKEQALNIN